MPLEVDFWKFNQNRLCLPHIESPPVASPWYVRLEPSSYLGLHPSAGSPQDLRTNVPSTWSALTPILPSVAPTYQSDLSSMPHSQTHLPRAPALSSTLPYFIFFEALTSFWDYLVYLFLYLVFFCLSLHTRMQVSWSLLIGAPTLREREKLGRWKLKYYLIPDKNE